MPAPIQPLPLSSWQLPSTGRPFLVAGPCGVETPEQVHSIAAELSRLPVHLIRGGIWKPRTRPDSFQGIGMEGLVWLKEAGIATGLPVAVEVATPRHVEEALSAGIDVLWIGARTTVNPFLVQELANALVGSDVPVMVKNPINPDPELWIGALERLDRSGIRKLAAIHRGFSSFDKSRFRNIPNWQIPIELKRRFPDLPMLCDPSHICGNREMIPEVAQTAMDLNFDGLMIEVHNNPGEARSDKEQQLTPSQYGELLGNLIIRRPSVDDVIFLNLLDELRDRIDRMDENILSLMADRMRIAREIGRYKKENNMAIYQVERWNEILRTRQQSGVNKELNREFIVRLYELIHEESIRHQTEVMKNHEITSANSPES